MSLAQILAFLSFFFLFEAVDEGDVTKRTNERISWPIILQNILYLLIQEEREKIKAR